MARSNSSRPQIGLTRDDRMMIWNPSLNIYKVNRFAPVAKSNPEHRFDVITNLLQFNMIHVVESVFGFVGHESAFDCTLVCHDWYEFLCQHMFRRWAEQWMHRDPSLHALAIEKNWLPKTIGGPELEERANVGIDPLSPYRRICRTIYELRQVWRYREPNNKRMQCDSFVLSIRFHGLHLFCGLNNGMVQLWDLNWYAKKREQLTHEKGVKSLAVNDKIFITGSYDCLVKIWSRSQWVQLHCINTHTDSIWDLKLHMDHFATASLDGSLSMFMIDWASLEPHSIEIVMTLHIQSSHDLVSSVDFDHSILVSGYEDSKLIVRSIEEHDILHTLRGHNGGVTGVQLNQVILASSSYDGSVRLWNTLSGNCLHVFNEPDSFVRCVGFVGNYLACGDFDGVLHVWDVDIRGEAEEILVRNHRKFPAHKGHVVSLQIDAQRIITGSRDKTALVLAFWGKMVSTLKSDARRSQPQSASREPRYGSRFLKHH